MAARAKILNVLSVLAVLTVLALGTAVPAAANGDTAQSNWATVIPVIDGVFGPGEWDDAAVVDLLTVPGNPMEGYWYIKNDAQYLYMLVDLPLDT